MIAIIATLLVLCSVSITANVLQHKAVKRLEQRLSKTRARARRAKTTP